MKDKGKMEPTLPGAPGERRKCFRAIPAEASAFILPPSSLFYDAAARRLDKMDQRLDLGDVLDVLFDSLQRLRSI